MLVDSNQVVSPAAVATTGDVDSPLTAELRVDWSAASVGSDDYVE